MAQLKNNPSRNSKSNYLERHLFALLFMNLSIKIQSPTRGMPFIPCSFVGIAIVWYTRLTEKQERLLRFLLKFKSVNFHHREHLTLSIEETHYGVEFNFYLEWADVMESLIQSFRKVSKFSLYVFPKDCKILRTIVNINIVPWNLNVPSQFFHL